MVTATKNKKKKVEEQIDEAPKSRFFYEDEKDTDIERVKIFIDSLEESSRGCIDVTVLFAKWRSVPLPIMLSDLSESLRSTKANPVHDDTEERDGMDSLKQSLIEESKKIDIVKKENFFNEEVTEEEREIIAQRVALQQKQFAAYEKRENLRKSRKIRKMFDYVSDEEILELLKQCDENEDEVIYCLTKPNYLSEIRKTIALKYAKEEESYVPLMTPEQRVAYKQLIKKRSVTLKKTTNDQAKKQYRMCGRLGLDEALEQFQNNQVDPEKAFEGWSQARIKAYQMIDQNPNSYYYRFNAPGEIQRKGQWDEPEKKMFFDRLADVGANGQWGLFSMTIPGRVGYQCSNFYRLLVETQTINDPNYVLDERGKAHYLFDKKSADGQIQKAFRTHTKHSSNSDNMDESGPSTAPPPPPPPRRVKKEPKPKEVKPKVEAPAEVAESSTKGKGRRVVSRAGTRRRRRARYDGSDSGDDSTLYDDDFSGNYTIRASREEDENGQRKSKRARQATPISTIKSDSIANDSWHHNDDKEIDPLCPLPGFIDPITLEQIIKPAISKYGHVMGYDSWTRCLNNWEGKKNICPLTKKALTKRDLG
ncbi:hypothetical protein INT48_005897 [Thamnidium elegans]|uniref:Myb-like domain-containing protein n=1 Tax=Thamnidium elegans TaxID=101142 RepID=A0A8H7SJJ7_9FUNG|nr:hypothetical protein INT48_005897 [Thamnidium elegans]